MASVLPCSWILASKSPFRPSWARHNPTLSRSPSGKSQTDSSMVSREPPVKRTARSTPSILQELNVAPRLASLTITPPPSR
ncbi:MAG: hypothetical protein LQ349_008836, partial [Xanthoria aureola]